MGIYDEQRAEFARTPQAIATLGVRYCANHYAQTYKQGVLYPTQLDDTIISYAKAAGTTVTANTHAAPDGSPIASDTAADTLAFAAANDYIRNNANLQGLVATSNAFTFPVWLRTTSGTGTISLRLQDSTNSESTEVVVNVTETWTRFSVARLFTAGASGLGPLAYIIRRAGDLATVVAWGFNLTQNPGNAAAAYLWPTLAHAAFADNEKASTCQAADAGDGFRCFYSFPTCQDRANFNAGNNYEATAALKGIREFRFCRQDGPPPLAGEDIRPYITGLDWASQEIDPEKSITTPERVSLRMAEDLGPVIWDPAKQAEGAKVNTASQQGTFWRRFRAIYGPYYANPECYAIVKRGFVAAGMTEALYVQRGKYLISNLAEDSDGGFQVECAGRLKLLTQKGPAKISSSNLLDGPIDGAVTTIAFDDVSEITEPPTDGSFNVVLLIESEKVNVVSRDLDANTVVVQRGRWGTTAAAHADNVAFKEVVEFGTERSTPSLTPVGKNPFDCVQQILRMGGIPAADIDSAWLDGLRDIWLPSTIDITTGDTTGTLFRRTVDDPTNWEALLQELREVLLLDIFEDEDQMVSGNLFAPALPTETLATLTDTDNFLKDSVSIDDNNESRVTRVVVAYDLINGAKGDEVGDYNAGQEWVEPELESRAGGGEKRWKIILSKWIQPGDTATASSAAAHIQGRYRNGVRKATASVSLRDDDKKCGQFVLVTTRKLLKPSGATDTDRQMLITKKSHREDDTIELGLVDAILPGRPGFIAPAGYPDYDSATAAQRRYCYIGSAGSNKVGAGQEDGYTIR
jgi:hypothetical protein